MSDEYTPYEPINPRDLPELIEVVNQKYKAGQYWADAVSVYNRLDRGLEIKLARIKKEIRTKEAPPDGKKAWTVDDLDDAAKSTKDYEELVTALDEAQNEMLKAINEKNTYESAFEALRSTMANERELAKNLKG